MAADTFSFPAVVVCAAYFIRALELVQHSGRFFAKQGKILFDIIA
jgi:hypothetical protein